jgi:hypothetical protein
MTESQKGPVPSVSPSRGEGAGVLGHVVFEKAKVLLFFLLTNIIITDDYDGHIMGR